MNFNHPSIRNPRNRGIAMLLVIITVALVTVLSLSFLSAQSTTTGITRNLTRVAQARQIAGSAITLAMAQIKADPQWRTTFTHGPWMTNESLAGGTVTLLGRDGIDTNGDGVPDGDGDLADDPADPLTLTATATFQGVTQTIHAVVRQSGGQAQSGLKVEFFKAKRTLSNLSHTDWNATPERVDSAEQINQPWVNGSGEAWPGGPKDEFAVRYTGKITIPVTGQYTFWTDSDDGSDLWIDGVRIVNNDDLHSMRLRSGSVQLTAGVHDIVARYFEWYGDFGMIVSWQGPGMASRQVVPPEAFAQALGGGSSSSPLLMSTGISLSNNARVAAWSGSSDDDDETTATSALVAVNATSAGCVSLSNNARIGGDVNIGPNGNPGSAVSISNNARIDGNVAAMTSSQTIPTTAMPAGLPASLGNVTISSSQTISANRQYANLTISGNARILIQGDVTLACTGTFILSDNARIDLDSGAKLTLYVANQVILSDNARFNNDVADPTRCQIIMTGTNRDMTLGGNARLWVQAQNPTGPVVMTSNARFYGTLIGKTLNASTNARINLASSGSGTNGGNGAAGPVIYSLDWLD